jgi:hypothetical protein
LVTERAAAKPQRRWAVCLKGEGQPVCRSRRAQWSPSARRAARERWRSNPNRHV